MEKVKVMQDTKCHWYIIPNDLECEFERDDSKEDMLKSKWIEKWRRYMVDNPNEMQLYVND